MADNLTESLYEQDLHEWTLAQVRALRILREAAMGQGDLTTALHEPDWDHLIEELEGLAGRDRRELQSRLRTIVQHLLKLQFSPAPGPRAGWIETVERSRFEAASLLRQSPSLRREADEFLTSDAPLKILKEVMRDFRMRGETAPLEDMAALAAGQPGMPFYTGEHILEDWWPAQPGEPGP